MKFLHSSIVNEKEIKVGMLVKMDSCEMKVIKRIDITGNGGEMCAHCQDGKFYFTPGFIQDRVYFGSLVGKGEYGTLVF